MSLVKYTVFINSLLTELWDLNLCCTIFTTPSTPVGFAAVLAACCLLKMRMDKTIEIL